MDRRDKNQVVKSTKYKLVRSEGLSKIDLSVIRMDIQFAIL
jgi:hypothetical protein